MQTEEKTLQHKAMNEEESIIEEHYVVAGEPHEFYLFHVVPTGGTGLKIGKAIFQVIERTQLQNSLAINWNRQNGSYDWQKRWLHWLF